MASGHRLWHSNFLRILGPLYPTPQVSPRSLYALLSAWGIGVGLSLLGCGYASVGYSVQPVLGKARAGVGSDVSGLQQFID